jgi:hypothetical protein
MPAWTLRALVPRHLREFIPLYTDAFRERLAMPLRPAVLEELRWYFHARTAPGRAPDRRQLLSQHAPGQI